MSAMAAGDLDILVSTTVIEPLSADMTFHSSRRAMTSSPSVGSSRNNTAGLESRASAMESLRCHPPESVLPFLLITLPNPNDLHNSSMRRDASALSNPRIAA